MISAIKPGSWPAMLFAFLLLPAIFQLQVHAQEMVFRSSEDGSLAMLPIPGGLLILEGEDEARVMDRIVNEESDETPDIKQGDLIIFLDGERISSAEQFNTMFESIAVGDEVKLGIQRGEDKMIRTFTKQEMQQNYSGNNGGVVRSFQFSGPGGPGEDLPNANLWPAGFMVGERGNQVVIGASLPLPNKAEALEALKQGDAILNLNGTSIKTVDELLAGYEAITVGDDVTLEYEHDGETHKVLFKKPEPPRMRMQIERN